MRCILSVFALLFVVVGCSSQSVKPGAPAAEAAAVSKSGAVTILYQSNRNGWLEPCGCHANPFGGIDREANAVAEIRATKRPVLYLDAGNAFAERVQQALSEAKRKRLASRAERLANILDTLGLDALAPGTGDLSLGLPELRSIALRSKFAWVSSNLLTRAGAPVFSPYLVIERGGVRYAVLAITEKLSESVAKVDDLVVSTPKEALDRWLPEARSRADVVVLMTQLPSQDNETLATQYPAVKVIIGADPNVALEQPLFVNGGQTLIVDPLNTGFRLGRLDLDVKTPVTSFYSPELAKENQVRLAHLYAQRAAKPTDDVQNLIREIENNDPLETFVPGATKYSGELIKLDVKHYGKPNAITQWVKEEKKRIAAEGRASAK